MRRWNLAVVCLALWLSGGSVNAAPADDGQTAGAHSWVLYQARLSADVTPSDTADLAIAPTRFLFSSGTSGNAACVMTVIMADGGTTVTTFTNWQVGVMYPMQVKRVTSTNNTCTNIRALY